MIFNLFKSKPTLKELIPKGFVDIHSHILPGIDDGAKTVEESKELISKMKKIGFQKIYATPHIYPGMYENNKESIQRSFNLLNKHLDREYKIHYASEYMIDISVLNNLKKKEILLIKDKYILIETGFMSIPYNLFDFIFQLRLNEITPIIAHPERYIYLHKKDLKTLTKLKKMGCKFQLNLLSVTDYYGKNVRKISDLFLKNNMIDFVGSDIHNINHVKQFDKKVKINNIVKLKKAIDETKSIFE